MKLEKKINFWIDSRQKNPVIVTPTVLPLFDSHTTKYRMLPNQAENILSLVTPSHIDGRWNQPF